MFPKNATEAAHGRAAFESYIHRRGVDRVPAGLVEYAADLAEFEATHGHSRPLEANPLPNAPRLSDGALVSHAEAAEILGVSTRTVRRRVAEGQLQTVGRRITLSSIKKATQ